MCRHGALGSLSDYTADSVGVSERQCYWLMVRTCDCYSQLIRCVGGVLSSFQSSYTFRTALSASAKETLFHTAVTSDFLIHLLLQFTLNVLFYT